MAKTIRMVRPRTVTGDGEGLVSHAGLIWAGEVCDRTGLTAGLCWATEDVPHRDHLPGMTLAQMIAALIDGAECASDLDALRHQRALFGEVASSATTHRRLHGLGPVELRRLAGARAAARATAWAAGAGPVGDETIIDFDSTIVRTRSDKEDAAATYKRTWGHHPLLAMIAETGEVLAGRLRAGNAGANNAEDHVVVLDAALAQLPEPFQSGHRVGDDPALVANPLLARADAGGASHWFVEECHHRNIGFSVGYHIDHRVRDALVLVQEEDWDPAIEPGGKKRPTGEVAELTHLVNLDAWPEGTRLIVRREDPHPGAQLSLFDTVEGKRHTAFITDSDGPINELELRHRQRARSETVIRDTKAVGLAKLPFDGVAANDTWMQLTFCANNVLAWGQRISLDGPLRRATPKTLRYRLFHVAGRTSPCHHRLRLDQHWPWTPTLTNALDRLRARLSPLTVNPKPAVHPGL